MTWRRLVLTTTAATTLLALPLGVGATPTLAQQSGGTGGWAPGPAASGDNSAFTGAIDTPLANATVSGPTLQVSGWFVDRTAQGWAGADDVEVFLGTLDGGGRPLAHAAFAQHRPDVGAAMGNPFFAQSGWSASVPTASLPNGPSTLSVYAHTPGRGWWFKQVGITLRPAPTPTPRPAPPPASSFGFDISYPQCPTGAEPAGPQFGIVGVNGGVPFSGNPCLARQYVWTLTAVSPSQPHVSFYLNTGNPGPTASSHWPAGASAPRACDGSWSADCAYDYGSTAAQDAYARAVSVAGPAVAAGAPWWLDVEAVNSWSSDPTSNTAALEGAIAYLRAANVATLGIYSTTADWATITGASGPDAGSNAPFATSLLNWRPGPQNPQEAPDWCARTITGGRVKLVQFPSGGFDANFVCF